MALQSFLQQRFLMGEVGERLNGMTNTEAYATAVKKAENVVISSIGSLRVRNEYEKVSLGITEDIVSVQDTKYNFLFLIGNTRTFVFNKITATVVSNTAHGITAPVVFNSFENFLIIGNTSTISTFTFNTSTGALGTVDYLAQITKPVRNRTPLKVGIYRWVNTSEYDIVNNTYKTVKKIVKIGTYDDFEKVSTSATGAMVISGIKAVKRMYFIASSTLTTEVFTTSEFSSGDTILNFEQGKIEDLYISGYNPKFNTTSTDGSGNEYATVTSISNIPLGVATRGEVINLTTANVKDMCVFQNRLCLITDTEVFFSEKFDYTNFLNGVEASSGFYMKPTPIRGTQPKLRMIASSKGLWINTDRGYYCLGFSSDFSATDAYIEIVSDRKPSMNHMLMDEILYFIDEAGILFAIFNEGENVIKFRSVEVDKFDINRNFYNISSILMDGTEYVAVQDFYNPSEIYLYRQTKDNFFSRVRMITEDATLFKGTYMNFFKGRNYYRYTNNFAKNVVIEVLPPSVQTKERGLYLNNTYKTIKQVVLKVLNENDNAVADIKINGIKVEKIQSDYYSVYTVISSFRFERGFSIEIEHTGNDSILEILGIEIFYE